MNGQGDGESKAMTTALRSCMVAVPRQRVSLCIAGEGNLYAEGRGSTSWRYGLVASRLFDHPGEEKENLLPNRIYVRKLFYQQLLQSEGSGGGAYFHILEKLNEDSLYSIFHILEKLNEDSQRGAMVGTSMEIGKLPQGKLQFLPFSQQASPSCP
eukprot:763002-Hanusia_phi.AAC.3